MRRVGVEPLHDETPESILVACWLCGGCATVRGALWRWTRPPRITVPPRQYPSPNAYEAYKKLAEGMKADLDKDARFREAEAAVLDVRKQAYLEMPSVAVFEYDLRCPLSELAQFRWIGRAEAFLMREALQAGRADEAVQRAADVMRFAEQTRNEGGLMQYWLGNAISTQWA